MESKRYKNNEQASLVKYDVPIIITTSNTRLAKKEFDKEEDEIFLRRMINERSGEVRF